MSNVSLFVRVLVPLIALSATVSSGRLTRGAKPKPPTPRYLGVFPDDYDSEHVERSMKNWTPEDEQNIWEMSGLYEGDIMVHPFEEMATKNGLLEADARWPKATVPYYIDEDNFNSSEIEVIEGAMREYKEKTCVRFRPYDESDKDFVVFKSDESGCWSSVGRKSSGQVVNLHAPNCVRHGIAVHELMHAIGFYHQQSAADRDDWVEIHWENIKEGKEHNFKKYDSATVTDYGITYDYKSIMHYSGRAFSKNKEETITPKKEEVKLGQRKGLTEKDIAKINEMYKDECAARETGEGSDSTISRSSSSASDETEENGLLDWLLE